MSFCGVNDEGIKRIALGLARSTTLEVLELESNDFGSKGLENLVKGIAENKSLKSLNLANNRLGDEGIGSVLEHSQVLQELDLANNAISDKGARDLARGLQHSAWLKKLNLVSNSIGQQGLCEIANALEKNPSEQLFQLLIHKNKYEDMAPMISVLSKRNSSAFGTEFGQLLGQISEPRLALEYGPVFYQDGIETLQDLEHRFSSPLHRDDLREYLTNQLSIKDKDDRNSLVEFIVRVSTIPVAQVVDNDFEQEEQEDELKVIGPEQISAKVTPM